MKTCICAIAKNENRYVREWCEYHTEIGFDTIYIFDNNDQCGEKIKDVIYDLENVIVDERYRGKNDKLYQTNAYTSFYKEHSKQFDWVAYIDIDEYITIVDGDIKSFLCSEKFNNADGVRLCWKCYTDSNHITVDNNYSVNRFTDYNSLWATQAKTIIRGGLVYVNQIGIHTTTSLKNAVNSIGFPCWYNGDAKHQVNIGEKYVWDCAYIKHYRFKTIQEFVDVKLKNWNQKYIKSKWINLDEFFKLNKKTPEKIQYLKSIGIDYE